MKFDWQRGSAVNGYLNIFQLITSEAKSCWKGRFFSKSGNFSQALSLKQSPGSTEFFPLPTLVTHNLTAAKVMEKICTVEILCSWWDCFSLCTFSQSAFPWFKNKIQQDGLPAWARAQPPVNKLFGTVCLMFYPLTARWVLFHFQSQKCNK